MSDRFFLESSASKIIVILLVLIAVVIMTGIGVCMFIDNRPTEIVQNHTNLYAQQADVWIVDGVRWRTVVEGKVFELKDMP
uniref:Uncharacterized protein n=1 Tax=viral metagenome TaxID=1070528 RepID=A0A6M3K2Q8_9ZZZZ